MANSIQCARHGECQETFVCSHLVGDDAAGLGFNRNEPDDDNPFPDAWCDDCEIIRTAHDGWNEQSEPLVKILMLCSGCYERALIRNARVSVTLNDLADLRWRCGSCEEWHAGPCLDFGYDSPAYWLEEHEAVNRRLQSMLDDKVRPDTFLNEDYCAIADRDFFVRGIIHLPIIGSGETFRWGVWGSLSRENFDTLFGMEDDPACADFPPMFSWLSNTISEYPDTLSLKMYAHIQQPNWRPHFELEATDHPLAREYHKGISAERVKEIMVRRLREIQ